MAMGDIPGHTKTYKKDDEIRAAQKMRRRRRRPVWPMATGPRVTSLVIPKPTKKKMKGSPEDEKGA
jgi:hypothetical protein